MYKCRCPFSCKQVLVSDSETESDDDIKSLVAVCLKRKGKMPMIDTRNIRRKKPEEGKKLFSPAEEVAKQLGSKVHIDRDALVELATKYQNFMKKIPIPEDRMPNGIVFNWQCLAKSLKVLHGQPLHYLTYMICKQWDESRIGSEDGQKILDTIFEWKNAQDTLWKVEEIHRLCTSPIHLANLWLSDPEYHAFVDEVIPSH